MRTCVVAAVVVLLAGCDGSTVVTEPHHRFQFAAVGAAAAEGSGDHELWRMEQPALTVTAQRIPSSSSEVGERTLDTVASALADRWSLQEIPGSMTKSRCAAGGTTGWCFVGWSEGHAHPDSHVQRSGVLVPVHGDFYLLEVIGENRSDVDRQASLIRATFKAL